MSNHSGSLQQEADSGGGVVTTQLWNLQTFCT